VVTQSQQAVTTDGLVAISRRKILPEVSNRLLDVARFTDPPWFVHECCRPDGAPLRPESWEWPQTHLVGAGLRQLASRQIGGDRCFLASDPDTR